MFQVISDLLINTDLIKKREVDSNGSQTMSHIERDRKQERDYLMCKREINFKRR